MTRRAALAPLTVALLVACAGHPRTPPPARRRVVARDAGAPRDAGADAPHDAGPRLPSFDALAARAEAGAPGMRELTRADPARQVDVALEHDACLRAVVAATQEVRAAFEDDAGAPRGEPAAGSFVIVPPKGPTCARAGARLHLAVDPAIADAGADVAARAIVLTAP